MQDIEKMFEQITGDKLQMGDIVLAEQCWGRNDYYKQCMFQVRCVDNDKVWGRYMDGHETEGSLKEILSSPTGTKYYLIKRSNDAN